MNKLYAVNPEPQATPRQAGKRRKKSKVIDYVRVSEATVRESQNPRYYPTGAFEFWWRQEVIKPMVREIERSLYG